MAKASQDSFKNPVSKDLSNPTSLSSSLSKQQSHKLMNVSENDVLNQDSVERVGSFEDLNSKFFIEFDRKASQAGRIKKSQSLESGLYQAEGDHCKTNSNAEFQVIPGLGNDCSLFSIGDPTPSDKDARENSDSPLSGDLACDSAEQTSGPSTPSLMKSRSLPNMKASMLSSGNNHALKYASSISRSSDDLYALGLRKKEVSIDESYDQIRESQERESGMEKLEDSCLDRYSDDGLTEDWIMPITDEISDDKTPQGDSSVDCLSEFPSTDFKVKRIEDWVTGLQHCAPPLEDINELPESVEPVVDVNTINSVTASVVDHKITPGMEAAKRYISSLTANATTAQLANHGLVVIPFLSAFVSLKVLNLSGNAIG